MSDYLQKISGDKIAVFGLGVSNISAIRFLRAQGVQVCAWDDKAERNEVAKGLGADIVDFIKSGLSGYAFLLLSPGVALLKNPHPIVDLAKENNVEIICDVELFSRCYPDLKTVGITGTNGKSTTTSLISHILQENGLRVLMGGNIGVPVFDLTPSGGNDVGVFELSSYQLDLCPSFRPDISVLLNITPDHLDRYDGMNGYIASKARILEGSGSAVIGVDDEYTKGLYDEAVAKGGRNITSISIHEKNIDLSGCLTLCGDHNYQNAAASFAVASYLGVSDEGVLKALKSYPGLKHRQFYMGTRSAVSFVNDSKATNADATSWALSSYKNIFWIVGGVAKSGGLSGLEVYKNRLKQAFIIGENVEQFVPWFKDNDIAFSVCHTMDRAVALAFEEAEKFGDKEKQEAVVLLSPACASFDQFRSFEERGDAFTQVVSEIIS